jgi:hypothetical protein
MSCNLLITGMRESPNTSAASSFTILIDVLIQILLTAGSLAQTCSHGGMYVRCEQIGRVTQQFPQRGLCTDATVKNEPRVMLAVDLSRLLQGRWKQFDSCGLTRQQPQQQECMHPRAVRGSSIMASWRPCLQSSGLEIQTKAPGTQFWARTGCCSTSQVPAWHTQTLAGCLPLLLIQMGQAAAVLFVCCYIACDRDGYRDRGPLV